MGYLVEVQRSTGTIQAAATSHRPRRHAIPVFFPVSPARRQQDEQ